MLTRYTRSILFAILFVLAITAWLSDGAAQNIGSGRRPGGAAGNDAAGNASAGTTTRPASGSTYGRILSYAALDWVEDGDPFAGVTQKPAGFRSHVQTYYLLAGSEPDMSLSLDLGWGEPYEELLRSGLFCTVHWRDAHISESARRPSHIVTRVDFNPVTVEGTLVSLQENDEDVIKLRVRPLHGAPWPHLLAQLRPGSDPMSARNKARLRRALVLRCDAISDLTEWLAEDGEPVNLSDFRDDQPIQATVVFGIPRGLLISIQLVEKPSN